MTNQKNTKTAALALLSLVVLAVGVWFIFVNKPASETSGATGSEIAGFAEGVHYQSLESPLASTAIDAPEGSVSVIEFFWYGCPHCQSFEPVIRQWLETAPDDVAFRQAPVVWNDSTALHAALFFVAEDAGSPEQLHDILFERIIALRPERNLASQLDQLASVYADYGITETAVKDLVESNQIKERVAASEKLMRQAGVSSTPSLVVDGKWAVLSNNEVAEAGGVLSVVDFLVQKARDTQ